MKNQRAIRRTDTGKEIESNIDSGKTKVFKSEREAIEYVKRHRGYHYPVYVDGKTNGEYAVAR